MIIGRERIRNRRGLRMVGGGAAILAGALALVLAPGLLADPYIDAARVIRCPAAPPGWELPPGEVGRFVLSPLTTMNENPGATSVQVTCTYRLKSSGGLMPVAVRYALPGNLNPNNDFAIGCSTSDQTGVGTPTGPWPWDTKNRLYRVVSPTSWTYATFYDTDRTIRPVDEPKFEAIAQALVESANPVAHDCTLNVTPSQIRWKFMFDAEVHSGGLTTTGRVSGSFVTKPHAEGFFELTGLRAPNIVLKIARGTERVGSVTLHITQAVSFSYSTGAAFRAAVEVKASTYTPCLVGATGTLTVNTTAHKTTLAVCGRNLLQGKGVTRPNIAK